MGSLMSMGVRAGPIEQGQLSGMIWDDQKQDYVPPAPPKWWTYNFGKGEFTNSDWQSRLQPPDEFGCVLVVQNGQKMEDAGSKTTMPGWTSAKYFPYCRSDAGQKASEKPLEQLGFNLYERPRDDQGQNWYILSGLQVSKKKGHETNVDANDVRKFVQKDGKIEEEKLDETAKGIIGNIRDRFPNPKYWAIGDNVDPENQSVSQKVFVFRERLYSVTSR